MKKLVFILLVAFSANSITSAQTFQVGLKAGLSSSKIKIDHIVIPDTKKGDIYLSSGDAILGWHVGLYSRIKVKRFYIQPELLFTTSGGNIVIENDGNTDPLVNEIKLNKLDIPILAGFIIGKSFRVYAGPSLSYVLSENNYLMMIGNLMNIGSQKAAIGYQAGIGFDITTVSIDIKYEGNFKNTGNTIQVPYEDSTFETGIRTPQIILSMGFRL